MSNPLVSLEAEQAVLGSVLSRPQVWDDVATLAAEDFAIEFHRVLWANMRHGEQFRDIVHLVTTATNHEDRAYIGDLVRHSFHASNVKFYAQIVKERSSLRKLAAACSRIISGLSGSTVAADAIAGAMREMEAIGEGAVIGSGPRHIGEIGGEWYEAFKARSESSSKLVGMSTGFPALDARWGGMRGGQVIVIAGRPKRGKSTLAANIAQHVAKTTPVLVFNMEMGALEIVDRSVSSEGVIDIGQIRNGAVSRDGWDVMPSVWATLKASQLYIDDTVSQTIDTIRLQAKAFTKRHGQSLIVVDYLQLIGGDHRQTAYERVSAVSRGLKMLAKETNCPVIPMVQMNRAIEGSGRKPQLSDLRDSGAIEQDADIITFVHQDDDDQEHSEIITRAMRSGHPGTDYLGRDFVHSRFVSKDESWEPSAAVEQAQKQQPARYGKRTKSWQPD